MGVKFSTGGKKPLTFHYLSKQVDIKGKMSAKSMSFISIKKQRDYIRISGEEQG